MLVLLAPAVDARLGKAGCGPRDELIEHLLSTFGEAPTFWMTARGRILEIVVSAERRTWSLIETGASGHSCILAMGIDFRRAPGLTDPFREPEL